MYVEVGKSVSCLMMDGLGEDLRLVIKSVVKGVGLKL